MGGMQIPTFHVAFRAVEDAVAEYAAALRNEAAEYRAAAERLTEAANRLAPVAAADQAGFSPKLSVSLSFDEESKAKLAALEGAVKTFQEQVSLLGPPDQPAPPPPDGPYLYLPLDTRLGQAQRRNLLRGLALILGEDMTKPSSGAAATSAGAESGASEQASSAPTFGPKTYDDTELDAALLAGNPEAWGHIEPRCMALDKLTKEQQTLGLLRAFATLARIPPGHADRWPGKLTSVVVMEKLFERTIGVNNRCRRTWQERLSQLINEAKAGQS